jgi:F-type H+-transporting ATPase subunit b
MFETTMTPITAYFLNAGHGGPTPFDNLLNFLIVFGFLIWVMNRFKIGNALDAQKEAISAAIQEANAKKAEAVSQLEEVKRRTANLNQEVEAILSTAKASAETLSAQILEEAQRESAKILDTAKRRVELEERSAAKALEARLLNDALHEARVSLTQSKQERSQDRSIEEFLEELARVAPAR